MFKLNVYSLKISELTTFFCLKYYSEKRFYSNFNKKINSKTKLMIINAVILTLTMFATFCVMCLVKLDELRKLK